MTPSLRRKGLRGAVTVVFDGDGLALTGTNGAVLVIRPGEVERMRAGVDSATKGGPTFETRIWTKGETRPVLITVRRNELNNYVTVIGGFAQRLPADRLEIGLTPAARRWTIGLLALPLMFALAVWAVPLRDKPIWQGAVVTALPALLLALAIRMTRKWVPRPAGTLASFIEALRGGI